ncbi:SurA N-terminal domain-containing protein [Bacterioplanes sanyensis]|nr:SurA N-terminal domain-containing protein [Bacterioplanes sanyensis]
MLQTMRDNAQGLIAKIIVGFIIVVFALFGVESIVSLGGGEQAPVTVGDYEISTLEISRQVEQQKSNMRRQFGEQFDDSLFNDGFFRNSAIEQLIEQRLALQSAEQMGLAISTAQLDQIIVNTPAFQVDGQFNSDQFVSILRLNGWTPMSYRDDLADDLKINQARAGMVLTSIETPFNAQMAAALSQEERSYRFVEYKIADLEDAIEVSDEDVQQYYQANTSQYQTAETVSVDYVMLSLADIAAQQDVSDDDITAAYEDYQQQLADNEQREVSHILIETNDERTDEQARQLANSLSERAKAGESFAQLAQEFSDDLGSKRDGGSLGIAARGAFVEPFEQVLYAMAQPGDISGAVETEFGYHVIRFDGIHRQESQSLEQVRAELEQEIRQGKAQLVYAEQLQELSNLAFSARSLSDISDALAMEIQTTASFDRNQGSGIALDGSVRQAAFADNVLLDRELSEVIETEQGAVVLAIREHAPQQTMPLEDVRERVVASLKRERAAEQAQTLAQAAADNPESVTDWQAVTGVASQSSEAPRAVQQRAFALANGTADAIATPGGHSALVVDDIQTVAWQEQAAEDAAVEELRMRRSRQDMVSYQGYARNTTQIERVGS